MSVPLSSLFGFWNFDSEGWHLQLSVSNQSIAKGKKFLQRNVIMAHHRIILDSAPNRRQVSIPEYKLQGNAIFVYQMDFVNQTPQLEIPMEQIMTILDVSQFHEWENSAHSQKKDSLINVLIRCTVMRLSPILTSHNDDEDAFSLMKVINNSNYTNDDKNTDKQSMMIIILRGFNILHFWHTGLLPGSNIELRSIQRKKWNAPFLENTTIESKYVTVLTNPSQIRLLQTMPTLNRKFSGLTLTPTTSIETIEGTIEHIYYTSRKNSKIIQHLTLISKIQSGDIPTLRKEMKLYLSYFPLDASGQNMLHIGCEIRAHLVHIIVPSNSQHGGVYGAHLQSKI